MAKPIKVSFDFDGTLSEERVQKYCKELIRGGMEVWVVTSRYSDDKMPYSSWTNKDLYEVTDSLSIPRERIVFTNHADKWHFFESNYDFIWHLDDYWAELDGINNHTLVFGISVESTIFEKRCNKLLTNEIRGQDEDGSILY